MKKQTIILIASAALVGTAAAMGIAKKIKDKKDEENEGGGTGGGGTGGGGTGGGGTGGGNTQPCGGRATDTSAYGLKVMALQKKVGLKDCDVDGLVGNQTNEAVKMAYPVLYSVMGGVTPNNIANYLSGTAPVLSLENFMKAIRSGKKAMVQGGLFNLYHTVYQNVKAPDGTWAESNLKTYIKGGIYVKPIGYFNNKIILELSKEDVLFNNPFYSYVRIEPTKLSLV